MSAGSDFAAEGGCTCGAVRYRMTSRPLFVHCCHCRWCQRETGSAFVLNAMIEADRVEMLIRPGPAGQHGTAAPGSPCRAPHRRHSRAPAPRW